MTRYESDFDPIEQVGAFRPTDDRLAHEWPDARRVAVLERAHSDGERASGLDLVATRRWSSRRWVAAAAIAATAAAVAVGSVVLPSGSPGSPDRAAAAPLERLAVRAAAAPADLVGPGRYWHLVDHESQDGMTTVQESWTSGSGRIWRRDEENDGQVEYYDFAPGNGSVDDPTPASLTDLPTEADQLNSYLRAHVSGSTSTDEAVYAAIYTIIASGFAPADLRAAAIRVLQRTGHVTVSNGTDSIGRPVVRADFVDSTYRPDEVQSLLFDPSTAALLEARINADIPAGPCPPEPPAKAGGAPEGATMSCPASSLHYTGTYTRGEVVDSVPAVVRHNATSPGGK